MARSTRNVRPRDGRWQIRWTDAAGKRRAETYGTIEDARFALRRHELEAEEVGRQLRRLAPAGHTFAELAEQWMRLRAPGKRSGDKDEQFLRLHLLPTLATRAVRDIQADAILELRNAKIASGLSPKTVNLILGLLGAMLSMATDDLRWIDHRPKVRLLPVPRLRSDYNYLETAADVRRFLDAAKEISIVVAGDPSPFERGFAAAFYATAVYTGLRAGELAALRWSAVDFDRRLILVRASFDGPTKSGHMRWVPLLDALEPVLRRWRLASAGDLIFPNLAGKMLEPCARVFQETLRKTLRLAGLAERAITFHGLRHTFASHWLMNGGDLFKLQKILGHASVQMTMRYAHLAPGAFNDDRGRLDALATGRTSAAVLPLGIDPLTARRAVV